ncbi:hypothetical protein EV286_107251 [Rhizobium sp. BK251]|nr:hypothetical protein EV286_107251 [Rhizobium sp. BK251]
MRRLLVIGLLVTCAGYAAWEVAMSRATTVRLGTSGYDLTYTMSWGLGMEEELRLTRVGAFMSGPSSGSIDIWKRPYNSGLALYRSRDGGIYYFGLGYELFTFVPSRGVLRASCRVRFKPSLTPFGLHLSKLTVAEDIEAQDAEASELFNYVESGQPSVLPSSPPASKYYADLVYLGKFGVVRSGGRGNDVEFAPADTTPEPRFGLAFNCY